MCFWITPPSDKVIWAALQGDYFANVFFTNPVVTLPGLARLTSPRNSYCERSAPESWNLQVSRSVCEWVCVCVKSVTKTAHLAGFAVRNGYFALRVEFTRAQCPRFTLLGATESLQIKGSAWIPSHVAGNLWINWETPAGRCVKGGKTCWFLGVKNRNQARTAVRKAPGQVHWCF